jgi:hypothetical protein
MLRLFSISVLLAAVLTAVGATPAGSTPATHEPKFSKAAAFDISSPLRDLAKAAKPTKGKDGEVRPDRGPVAANRELRRAG